MTKISMPKMRVFIGESTEHDNAVGRNENTDTNDKVQAFVDAFQPLAIAASVALSGLPAALILAQWGAESGWGTTALCVANQNWGGLKAGDAVISKGRDARGFSIFYGQNTFADAYVSVLNRIPNYAALRAYLAGTQKPSIEQCIDLIAKSGYCEGNPAAYGNLLSDCIATLRKRSDFFAD